jgi:opacity protein-like surface antigen
MTQKITMKNLLLALAALGLAASVSAQTTAAAAPTPGPGTGTGLLGQTYTSLGYSYDDLSHSSVNLQGLRFEYNQPLNTGFDLKLGYTGARTSEFSGTRDRQQSFDASAIAFIPETNWGRPYIDVGAGWIWTRNAGVNDNSFLYHLAAGVEYQLTSALSLTPYVTYLDAQSITVINHWNYGVKSNYWLTNQWGLGVGIGRDNKQDMTYSAGVRFRF